MKSKTGVLLGRLMRNIMRSPDTIITVAITPIMMMLLFVYVFGAIKLERKTTLIIYCREFC